MKNGLVVVPFQRIHRKTGYKREKWKSICGYGNILYFVSMSVSKLWHSFIILQDVTIDGNWLSLYYFFYNCCELTIISK